MVLVGQGWGGKPHLLMYAFRFPQSLTTVRHLRHIRVIGGESARDEINQTTTVKVIIFIGRPTAGSAAGLDLEDIQGATRTLDIALRRTKKSARECRLDVGIRNMPGSK